MIPTFKLIWRDGAYYVSEPNIDSCEVVRKADHDSTVKGLIEALEKIRDLDYARAATNFASIKAHEIARAALAEVR